MTISTPSHSDIPSVLQRIVATKHDEVAAARKLLSLEDLQEKVAADKQPRRGFASALRGADIGIIAEIKKHHLLKVLSITTLLLPYLLSSMSKQVQAVCLY